MILGVDPGYAKCGWSIVEPKTGRVLALGLITTMKVHGLHVSADRAVRVSKVCDKLAALAQQYGVKTIAAEQALGFGASAAIAANLLPWGAVLMLARTIGVELFEVSANEWQCAILGIDPKAKKKPKNKYATVEKRLTKYVGKQLANVLDGLDKDDRRHPLDAVGAGMLVGLQPRRATRIVRSTDAVFSGGPICSAIERNVQPEASAS